MRGLGRDRGRRRRLGRQVGADLETPSSGPCTGASASGARSAASPGAGTALRSWLWRGPRRPGALRCSPCDGQLLLQAPRAGPRFCSYRPGGPLLLIRTSEHSTGVERLAGSSTFLASPLPAFLPLLEGGRDKSEASFLSA